MLNEFYQLVRLMICDNNKRSINLVKKKTISVWIPFDQSQLIPVIDNKKNAYWILLIDRVQYSFNSK